MAIRRLDRSSRFNKSDRSSATVFTLPTVKVMVDCFEKYLNLTIADDHASNDTVKTYRSRVHQFLCWCKEKELYPALVVKQNVLEYRKYLVDGEKTSPTIRLSLLAIKHFYTACLAQELVKNNPVVGVKAPRERRERSVARLIICLLRSYSRYSTVLLLLIKFGEIKPPRYRRYAIAFC